MNLLEYLPKGYGNSPQIRALVGGVDQAVADLWAREDGFLAQLDVHTATWGLHWWEEALGIEVDESRDPAFRRSRIISKLRGQGTTTVAMVKTVAESFSNGAVDIVERPAEYRLEIKFVGTIGIPPNMEDLSAALNEILPAHLAYDYIIIYRTWGQVANRTWGDLAAKTWSDVLGGELT